MLSAYEERIALGSPITLVLVISGDQAQLGEVFRLLWLQIFEFEQQFSRFIPDSELSQFNRAAGVKTAISTSFYEILHAAQSMTELTGGIYNPFILPALQSAGYVQSMVTAHRDDDVDNFSNRTVVDPKQLKLTTTSATIPYGTALDLGGIGKGYLGDQLADFTDTIPEITGFWFSLGGDIVAGGTDPDGAPWTIAIEDVTAGAGSIAGHYIPSAPARHAVATSSTLKRKGSKEGMQWHHIIDPRTNVPSRSDVQTASISALSLQIADVLATCAVILGSDTAASYCIARGATGVLLQTATKPAVSSGDISLSDI